MDEDHVKCALEGVVDEDHEAKVEADVNDGVPMLQAELLLLQITRTAKLALSPAAHEHISDLCGKRTGAGTGNEAVELARQAAAHQLGHAPRGPYEIGDILGRRFLACNTNSTSSSRCRPA
jgi:hypothetical protein